MKKTYQNPEMEVVRIETTQMIAASVEIGSEGSADEAEAPLFGGPDGFPF